VRAEGDEQMPTIQELEFAIEQMNNIEVTEGNEEYYQRTLKKKIADIRRRHNGSNQTCQMCSQHKLCLYPNSNRWTCEDYSKYDIEFWDNPLQSLQPTK